MGKETMSTSNYLVSDPQFTADEYSVGFTYCQRGSPCMIVVRSLRNDVITKFKDENGNHWRQPAFSRDGRYMVFQKTTVGGGNFSKLMLMDLASMEVKSITRDNEYAMLPSFSHNNSEIVFIKELRLRRGNVESYAFDFFAISLVSGLERKITNRRFLRISRPYFLGESAKIIFSAIEGLDPVRKVVIEDIFIADADNVKSIETIKKYDERGQPSVDYTGNKILFIINDVIYKNRTPYYEVNVLLQDGKIEKEIHRAGTGDARVLQAVISPTGKEAIILLEKSERDYAFLKLQEIGGNTTMSEIKIIP